MRFLLASALTLALALALPAQAPPAPTVEVRLRGVSDLLDRFEYLAKLVDQEDAGQQLTQTIQSFADVKTGIEGIDPARPIALYATVAANPLESLAVVVLPIADEKAFLELLTGKLSLDPKKGDGGVYALNVPNVPLPLFFRFADKCCYLTVATPAGIDPKQLVSPAKLFAAKDDGLLTVSVRLDRIPADLKKTALGQLEFQLADTKAKKDGGDSPGQTALKGWVLDRLAEVAAAVLTDGKEFTAKLVADPKGDDLALDFGLTAAPGSSLARTLAGLAGSGRTTAAPVPTPSDALATLGVTGALGPKATASLAAVVDKLLAELVANAKDADKIGAKLVLDALAPTLKAGLLDLNLAVGGGDGKLSVVAAAAVVKGKGIEATAKQLAPFVPAEQVKFAFDQGTAGGLTLHKLTVADPKLSAATGSDAVWLATGDTKLVVGVGPGGTGVKAAATADPTPAALAAGTLNLGRLFALGSDDLTAAAGQKLVTQVFGDAGPAGRDTVTLRVAGGDGLRVRLAAKGKALQLAVLADKERKK